MFKIEILDLRNALVTDADGNTYKVQVIPHHRPKKDGSRIPKRYVVVDNVPGNKTKGRITVPEQIGAGGKPKLLITFMHSLDSSDRGGDFSESFE